MSTSPPEQNIGRVAIHGLGLMGGSLGLALRDRGVFVAGYARRPETRAAALERGIVDACFADPAEAAAEADIVVLCTPVMTIPELAASIAPALKPDAIITDVGSTKAWLHQQIEHPAFVGSHPMCGSEKTGLEASFAGLYQDAVTIVTSTKETSAAADEHADKVAALWKSIGSRVICMPPQDHDKLVARTSHLPHLAASLLVAAANRERTPHLSDLMGSGYESTTRLAEGSADVWHDIVKTNAPAVRAELAAFRAELDQLLQQIDDGIDDGDFAAVRDFLDRQAKTRISQRT